MWHRVTKWANADGKNATNRFAWCRAATNLQLIKNTISAKHTKAEFTEKRYACIHHPSHALTPLLTQLRCYSQSLCVLFTDMTLTLSQLSAHLMNVEEHKTMLSSIAFNLYPQISSVSSVIFTHSSSFAWNFYSVRQWFNTLTSTSDSNSHPLFSSQLFPSVHIPLRK